MADILKNRTLELFAHINELIGNIETVQFMGKHLIKRNAVELGSMAIDTLQVISSLVSHIPSMETAFRSSFMPYARELAAHLKRIDLFIVENQFVIGTVSMPNINEEFRTYCDESNESRDKLFSTPDIKVLHIFFLLNLNLRYLIIVTLDSLYLSKHDLKLNPPLLLRDGTTSNLDLPESRIIDATSSSIRTALRILCDNYMHLDLRDTTFKQLIDEICNRISLLLFIPHNRKLMVYIDDALSITTEDNTVKMPSMEWLDYTMCCVLSLLREQATKTIRDTDRILRIVLDDQTVRKIQAALKQRAQQSSISGKREQVLTERLLFHSLPCDIFYKYYRKFGKAASNIDVLIAESLTNDEIKELKKKAMGSDIGLLNIKTLVEKYSTVGLPAIYIYTAILEDILLPVFRNTAIDETGFFGEFFIRRYAELNSIQEAHIHETTPCIIVCNDKFYVYHENSLVDVGNDAVVAITVFISYLQANKWIAFKKSVKSVFDYESDVFTDKLHIEFE